MLFDRHVGEGDVVIGAVPVLVGAVAVVGAHDRDPPAALHRGVHLFQEGGDRLLVVEVLEEVGDEDAVEVVAGELGVHDHRGNHGGVGLVGGLLVADGVDRPGLLGGDRADELAAAGGRVEDLLRAAHQAVDVGADLLPDRDPAVLVDVAEAEAVKALVVHVRRVVLSGGGAGAAAGVASS